ncbi:sce7726 family protein [Vibrio fluvialis]|nr:sce7726 family protein [Vibrio fluvialis]
MLNDKKIREELIKRLIKKNLSESDIFEEIAVKRGLAVADVVANFNTPHCYEIKSDVDSLTRLTKQSIYFSDVFKKVTLVTTEKHLEKAQLIVPEWWGIIVAKESTKNKIVLKYSRASKVNPKNTTENLLNMLWNEELKSILSNINAKFKSSDNRASLVKKLVSITTSKDAEQYFVSMMKERHK